METKRDGSSGGSSSRAPPSPLQGSRQRTLDYATRLLETALRTSVAIKPRRKGGGRIVIDYSDAEELERLITHLRSEKERR